MGPYDLELQAVSVRVQNVSTRYRHCKPTKVVL